MEMRQLYNNKVCRAIDREERKEVVYQEGELVWIKEDRPGSKLARPWKGPYQVVKKVSNEVVEVQRRGEPFVTTLHVSSLKPYYEKSLPEEITTEQPLEVKRTKTTKVAYKNSMQKSLEPIQDVWEVESMDKHCVDRYGGIQYKVRWKGYPKGESTWEPETNMKGAEDAVRDYYRGIGGDREELRVRLEALLKETNKNRRLPLIQWKWRARDLIRKTSPYNIDHRTKEGLQRDIGKVTSFAMARELLERILEAYDQVYPPSHRSSKGGTRHVRSKGSGSRSKMDKIQKSP